MSAKHLSREPLFIRGNENVWWYEEEDGIRVIIDRGAVDATGAAHAIIPWKYIRQALERLDKK